MSLALSESLLRRLQAGSAGPLQRGGFARDLEWEVAGTSCGPWDRVLDPAPTVTLVATDNDATREAWPHAFKVSTNETRPGDE